MYFQKQMNINRLKDGWRTKLLAKTSSIFIIVEEIEKISHALQQVKAILIFLLLYGLAKVKFTVKIRLYIYIYIYYELQLRVWSSQVSTRVFLKKTFYTTFSVFPKANELIIRFKYGYVFLKTNNLKYWLIYGWRFKVLTKTSPISIIVEIFFKKIV